MNTLSLLLKKLNQEVINLHSREELFDQKKDDDLIIIDLHIDAGSGREYIVELTAQNPGQSILAIGDKNNMEEALLAMEAGSSDYIVKPIQPARLTKSVEALLTDPGGAAPSPAHNQGHEAPVMMPLAASDNTLFCNSAAMQKIADCIPFLAPINLPMSIFGSDKSGKEDFITKICSEAGLSEDSILKLDLTEFGVKEKLNAEEADLLNVFASMGLEAGAVILENAQNLSEEAQKNVLGLISGTAAVSENDGSGYRLFLSFSENANLSEFNAELMAFIDSMNLSIPRLSERSEDLLEILQHFFKNEVGPESKLNISRPALNQLKAYKWPGGYEELHRLVKEYISPGADQLFSSDQLPSYMKSGETSVQLLTVKGGDEATDRSYSCFEELVDDHIAALAL